ncbi:MarR family winged helix-turn-helix transcriptional regulator [Alteraurantiacibacter aquimixticola]|uniref:MarR family transcriptional regulator n=1 Tax=Alteraurantiacibacter aquimixticola TaxID=2489173 RepID=A0A4T3EZ27_9SPHN|nr:MarR family transcriptional regulator [Alteraurantiacibacter aquimixticola]TIX48784.1 MarR family transcriptional regulator [Alteraurantiacibacter aquimixticola]
MLAELTGFSVKLVWILGYSLLQRAIDDPAITPLRFSMLELVGRNPGTAQVLLGNALGLSRSAATLAIDFWAERGCVERRIGATDRRSFGVYLTEAGARELERLRQRVLQADAALVEGLTADEVAELNRLLGKIHL